jgi:hypothetical protein
MSKLLKTSFSPRRNISLYFVFENETSSGSSLDMVGLVLKAWVAEGTLPPFPFDELTGRKACLNRMCYSWTRVLMQGS